MSRTSELAHLFRAMKAPAAARALPKLADRARQEEWSYERFAQALLATEQSSREAHGGEGRIRAARFPARKTLEEFDFTFQRSVKRQVVEHLAQLDFLHAKDNVVLLGPPGTGKTHLAIAISIPFDPEAANLMFSLVSARYERASMIVTSNKPFSAWGEIFGDDVVAAAMIDRLVLHADILSLKGDSYRLRDKDLGAPPPH